MQKGNIFAICFDDFFGFRAAKINEKSIKNRIQNAIQDGKAQSLFHFGRKSSLRRLPDAPRRPKIPQETPQDGPRRPQGAPKTAKMPSRNAVCSQPRCIKMPKMAQEASKMPQEASKPRFWQDFSKVSERYWGDF